MNTQTNTATLSPGLDVAALCENAREMVAHEAPLYEQLRPRSKDMFANRVPGFTIRCPSTGCGIGRCPFPLPSLAPLAAP